MAQSAELVAVDTAHARRKSKICAELGRNNRG
jgi:hypothetical protein